MAEAALLFVFLLAGLAVTLVFWQLIDGETRERRTMHRSDAEERARSRARERYTDDRGESDHE